MSWIPIQEIHSGKHLKAKRLTVAGLLRFKCGYAVEAKKGDWIVKGTEEKAYSDKVFRRLYRKVTNK